MTTPNLEIPEGADSQTSLYAVYNAMGRILEQAICGRLTIDFATDADYTLDTTANNEEWRDKFIEITDTGVVLTTGRDIVFPDKNGPEYIVTNSTAQTLTLKLSGQTGVTLTAGSTGRFYNDGSDMVAGP